MTFACVFPGQGAQSVGMLSALAKSDSIVQQTFAEASNVLDLDLWRLCSEGPEETLNQTMNTQPAMLSAGVAVWRCWKARGGQNPALVAGHSLGEYTALVCSGALEFQQAVGLVQERARLMQEAVPEGDGAMAAILGLPDDDVQAICAASAMGEIVAAVNFNAPGQVVVAGHATAVKRALAAAKDAGAKRAMILPVSVPSHCALMMDAAHELKTTLKTVPLATPMIPVIHNVDVQTHNTPEEVIDALARQLHHPVRWVETITKMSRQGVTHILEMGPGKVLTGLNKRIQKSLSCHAIFDATSMDAAFALIEGGAHES